MKNRLTFLLLILPFMLKADSWTQKASFGGGDRVSGVGLSIGSFGYIGTGWDGINDHADFWQYDPTLDTWTQKASFPPGPREAITCFEISGKGYLATGTANQNDLWEYDPAGNSWTQKTNFSGTARFGAAAFTIGNKGYLGTGNALGTQIDDWWEYNPVTNAWTQNANVPGGPRMWASAFVVNAKGYIALGLDPFGKRNDLQEYDPVNNAWTQKATFPGIPRDIGVAFSIGDFGYFGTGRDTSAIDPLTLIDFWQYDPATDSWTMKASINGLSREWAVGFSIGNKGYLGTGDHFVSPNVYAYLSDFYEYSPDSVIPQAPTANLLSSDTALCVGICLDFSDLSLNGPNSWQWLFPGSDSTSSNIQNPSGICYHTPGSYDVTLIACNGLGCDTLFLPGFITVSALPVPIVTEINDTLYSTPAASYQWWSVDSGLIAGATNAFFVYQQYGTYYVVVTDSAGCEGVSNPVLITSAGEINAGLPELNLAPNPFHTSLTITFPERRIRDYVISIRNISGAIIYEQRELNPRGKIKTIQMTGFPGGIYFVEVVCDGERIVKKMLKD